MKYFIKALLDNGRVRAGDQSWWMKRMDDGGE